MDSPISSCHRSQPSWILFKNQSIINTCQHNSQDKIEPRFRVRQIPSPLWKKRKKSQSRRKTWQSRQIYWPANLDSIDLVTKVSVRPAALSKGTLWTLDARGHLVKRHNTKFPNLRDLENWPASSSVTETMRSVVSGVKRTSRFSICWNSINSGSVHTNSSDINSRWQGRQTGLLSLDSPQSSLWQKAETWDGCKHSLIILVIASQITALIPSLRRASGRRRASTAAAGWSLQKPIVADSRTREAVFRRIRSLGRETEHRTWLGHPTKFKPSSPARWDRRTDAVKSSATHGSVRPRIVSWFPAPESKQSCRISWASRMASGVESVSDDNRSAFREEARLWIWGSRGGRGEADDEDDSGSQFCRSCSSSCSVTKSMLFFLSSEKSPNARRTVMGDGPGPRGRGSQGKRGVVAEAESFSHCGRE